MSRKALSRRTFLRGGGVAVALPFLDAMIPTFANAQAAQAKRFLVAFNGSVGGGRLAVPAAAGALPASLPAAYNALSSVRQHVSLVSGMMIPTFNTSSGQAFIPGGAENGQHGFTRGPILCGMGSYESMQIPQACKTATQPGNQTCDQYAADAFASAGTKFRSLELKVQAMPYNGNTSAANGAMSARKQGNLVSSLVPKVSPVEIYNMLFSNISGGGTPVTPPSAQLVREKSVLDLVLEDATRLVNSLSGDDKARMDLHFTEIRNVERSIAAQMAGGTGGGTGAACTKPTAPPADTPHNTLSFGGWANETLRGQLQADMIAFAFACDLTRAVTWMITHDQCWLNSNMTSGSTIANSAGGVPDIHNDSHMSSVDIVAGNTNWHAALFARLINNLATRSDAGGPLINNTFAVLMSPEGGNAHSRQSYVFAIAGNGARVNLGQHIVATNEHPARVMISGLQSLGVNMNNTMGQVSGVIPGLLK